MRFCYAIIPHGCTNYGLRRSASKSLAAVSPRLGGEEEDRRLRVGLWIAGILGIDSVLWRCELCVVCQTSSLLTRANKLETGFAGLSAPPRPHELFM